MIKSSYFAAKLPYQLLLGLYEFQQALVFPVGNDAPPLARVCILQHLETSPIFALACSQIFLCPLVIVLSVFGVADYFFSVEWVW